MMKGKLLYEEEQKMAGTWMWYALLVMTLSMTGLFGWGMYVQLVLGRPWGDKPMDDPVLILVSCFSILLLVVLLVFVGMHRLRLQIDAGGLSVTFRPYFGRPRMISREQIQEAHVRRYSPLLEYGGWGMRIAPKKSRAYSISGRWGLQLLLADGSRLLIGTRRPQDLDKAIEKFNQDG